MKFFETQKAGVCTLRMTAHFRSHRQRRPSVTYPSFFDCRTGPRVSVRG